MLGRGYGGVQGVAFSMWKRMGEGGGAEEVSRDEGGRHSVRARGRVPACEGIPEWHGLELVRFVHIRSWSGESTKVTRGVMHD